MKMPTDSAVTSAVLLGDVLVGELRLISNVTTFELYDTYLEMPSRPTLGRIFEENPLVRLRQSMRVPVWFSNILPEGRLRDLVATGLGVGPMNEFALLQALGNDLPGAVSVIPAEGGYGINPRREEDRSHPDAAEKAEIRFSVAGVQLKLSMLWSGNTLRLAGRGALGDHYVKFPSRIHASVPKNEFLVMQWAKKSGIVTPDFWLTNAGELGELPVGLRAFENDEVYVIKRFDRTTYGSVHIEDFNQVVGQWPEHKYHGVNYEGMALLVRVLCGEDDYYEYLRRLVFLIGSGNEDAHLKNWSLIYPDAIRPRLAPAYDLVSTILYEDLDRGLGLKIGGQREFANVTDKVIRGVANRAGMDEAQSVDVARGAAARMWSNLHLLDDGTAFSRKLHARVVKHMASIPLFRKY